MRYSRHKLTLVALTRWRSGSTRRLDLHPALIRTVADPLHGMFHRDRHGDAVKWKGAVCFHSAEIEEVLDDPAHPNGLVGDSPFQAIANRLFVLVFQGLRQEGKGTGRCPRLLGLARVQVA